jgi:hypothetical protein
MPNCTSIQLRARFWLIVFFVVAGTPFAPATMPGS